MFIQTTVFTLSSMEGIQLRKNGTIKMSLKHNTVVTRAVFVGWEGFDPLHEVADPH